VLSPGGRPPPTNLAPDRLRRQWCFADGTHPLGGWRGNTARATARVVNA
jgi:hypothetical protein